MILVALLSSRIKAFLNLCLGLSFTDANKPLLWLKTLLLAIESHPRQDKVLTGYGIFLYSYTFYGYGVMELHSCERF